MSAKFPRGGGGGSRTFFSSKSNTSYNFIKVENSRPNWFVIFITNDRSFGIIEVIWNI